MTRYNDSYLDEIVETQGRLFDEVSTLCPGIDVASFINDYMRSRTRAEIDNGQAYVGTMSAEELWDYFLLHDSYKPEAGNPIPGFAPDWIGQFYAYYQWYYGIPSSQVIERVPLEYLMAAYNGLHDLELDLAVKKAGDAVNTRRELQLLRSSVGDCDPPLTVENGTRRLRGGGHPARVICFHNPDEENGYLSNWYLSPFEAEGRTFSSMEQYMMYQKAMRFKDHAAAGKIMATTSASAIKALGRAVSNYNEAVWNGFRQIIVYNGLIEKFRQNAVLKEKLLGTGDAVLAECAIKDRIWGIGLGMKDPERLDMTRWKGSNLLGFTLMAVRDELRREE